MRAPGKKTDRGQSLIVRNVQKHFKGKGAGGRSEKCLLAGIRRGQLAKLRIIKSERQ